MSMMKKMIQIVIISLVLPGIHSNYNNVSSCPECVQKWKQRAAALNCPFKNFHCILDTDGNKLEACLTPNSIAPYEVGCPSVRILNGRAILRLGLTECPDSSPYCPSKNHPEFSTNELYKYPICLVTVNERAAFQGHCCKDTVTVIYRNITLNVTSSSGEGVTRECTNRTPQTCNCSTCCAILGCIVAAILLLPILVFVTMKVKSKRKGENVGFQHLIPQKNLKYQRRKRHFVLLESICKDNKEDLEKTTRKLSCLNNTAEATEATCYLCTIASPLLYAALMKKKTAFNFLIERTKFDSMTGEQISEILHYCLVNDWLDLLHKSATLWNNVYIPGKKRLSIVGKEDFVQNGGFQEGTNHVYVMSQKLEKLEIAYSPESEEE